jgi:ATP-dependent Zn protease
MTRLARRKLSTAHHEAGHAIVAYSLKRKFKYVTIKSDWETHGYIKYMSAPNSRSRREFVEMAIMCSYAGRIAQEKYNHRRARYGHGCDNSAIADLLQDFSPEIHVHWARWLHARASNIVKIRWPCITAVAEALIQRETLTWSDIKAIVSHVNSAPPAANSR